MPLNTQEGSGSTGERTPAPLPITRPPENGGGHTGRIIGIIFTILVVVAAVFLLYTYGFFDFQKGSTHKPPTAQSNQSPHEDLTRNQRPPEANVTVSPAPAPAPAQQPAPSPQKQAEGRFTIYIGSYKDRAIADEEVGRWVDAGFTATVKQSRDWYCVQLGRFENIAETRDIIDTLKDGFEGGYFVGPV